MSADLLGGGVGGGSQLLYPGFIGKEGGVGKSRKFAIGEVSEPESTDI